MAVQWMKTRRRNGICCLCHANGRGRPADCLAGHEALYHAPAGQLLIVCGGCGRSSEISYNRVWIRQLSRLVAERLTDMRSRSYEVGWLAGEIEAFRLSVRVIISPHFLSITRLDLFLLTGGAAAAAKSWE